MGETANGFLAGIVGSKRLWREEPHAALRYGAAILLALLAQAVRLPLHPPTVIPYITYVPFMLVACFGGFGPGLLATVLCVVECMYFAVEPVGSFVPDDTQHWFAIGAFALTGVVASALFQRLKVSERSRQAAYLELATIQGGAPVMLLVVDDALRVRKANDLAVQFSGRTATDVLGLAPGSAIGCFNAMADPGKCGSGPECAECAIRLTILDSLHHGSTHSGVEAPVLVSGNGGSQKRFLQVSTVPMQTGVSRWSVLVCAQDITERKQAEAELTAQRDMLRQQGELINLSHDAIILMEENRVITGWNTGAEEMYGWTQQEAVGSVLHVLAGTGAQVAAGIDQVLGRAGRWDGELEHTRRDRTRIIVDSRQVLLRNSAGNPEGILEINRDITEAKRNRQEVEDAHRRITAILESISDGFVVFDREWRYTYVNPAATRLLRKSREELLGQSLWDLWPAAAGTPAGPVYHRAMEERVPVQFEAFYPEPLNAWFEVRCSPSPEGLSLFFTDVTTRRTAQDEIQRLNAELEQRVRERTAELEAANKELETFAYSVSHDLRSPLRGIDGWSMALVEDYGNQLDEEAHHYLARVRSEAQRMGQLIDDLLKLSRVTRAPLTRDRVDLSALAAEIAGRLRESHPDREVEFVIQPELIVLGDEHLLEVALDNLLGNAVKFTGKCDHARIEFARANQNGGFAFCVRDNGAGFDMAYASHLFGAFQRLHRASEFPGTGIGLATVQRVIRRHGGRIWAEAQPGRGATFYFTLGEKELAN